LTGKKRSRAATAPPDAPSRKGEEEIRQEEAVVTRPFEGVKILDFTQVLAGPYASYQLALLGADVIKVERRGGEDMRRTPLSREWADRGLAPGWQAINGNKRSLTLDLSRPEAITIVKQLAAQADVVMENFRPGVMDKLGIGYTALSAINPRLIYCAISGFGQTGPERLSAGYDGKIQALSGIMAITGHEESGPTRAGFAVCDVLSGATAAFGVSSALFQRTHTGRGQLVDVSMLEATLAFLSGQVADYTVAGHCQQLSGNQAVSRRPTANLFKAGKGYLLLAVNSEKQYRALMVALGRKDALEDPRFADWFSRQENEPALRAIIEDALAKEDPREWEKILDAAGAPCASIWKVEEVIDHPQIAARHAIQDIDTPFGRLRFAGSGFQLAHGGGRLDTMAPELGAHTDEVLSSLGYGQEAIADLRAREIV
jgi:crotonobetainyl-CoA:carnitine CoA-transferase CaiB-like acyl-CoA transferase